MAVYLLASKVVAIALSQVGYKESGNNWTKYSRDLDSINFFNGKKQGQEWCDIFVDWCVWQASGKSKERALKALYEPQKDNCGAGCKFSARYYRANGAWYKTPKVGDQIFFGSEGSETHTGVVVSVGVSTVTTVEGNKSNSVKKCSYSKSDKKIAGYGRPRYDSAPQPEPQPQPKPKEGIYMFEVKTVKKGTSGADTLLCQELLYAKGYKGKDKKALTLDGKCGDNTVYAINSFQTAMRKKGIECGTNGKNDGSCGANCWAALLGV